MKKVISLSLVIIISLFLIGCNNSNSTTYGSIKGVVIDKESNDPLINAKISGNNRNISTITNDEGVFTFDNVKTGDITLNIEKNSKKLSSTSLAVGYDGTIDLVVSKGENSLGELEIKPFIILSEINSYTNSSDEIIVQAKAKNNMDFKLSKVEIKVIFYNGNDTRVSENGVTYTNLSSGEEVLFDINTGQKAPFGDNYFNFHVQYEN